MKYHKLVRDRIPEIIKTSGDRCVTEILSQDEYVKQLDQKLQEELTEYYQEPCLEELADLLEVIHAVAVARGYTVEQLEEQRVKKAQERGGFENRILLKEVISSFPKE